MAYRDFKIADIEKKFGTKTHRAILFDGIKSIEPSAWLIETLLKKRKSIRPTTEKAFSEIFISPILTEIQTNNTTTVSLFSGETMNSDRAIGLSGIIDFLFVKQANAFEIHIPFLTITQAKLNQAIEKSIAQASAQMIGARIFNQKNGEPIDVIHGVVTDSKSWIFLKLENNELLVDNHKDFSTSNLPEILGIFQKIIDFYN
jgi:uncharacterized protein YrrD